VGLPLLFLWGVISKPASFVHRATTEVAQMMLLLGMTQNYSMLLKLIVGYSHSTSSLVTRPS
jgi:hypothetical protein